VSTVALHGACIRRGGCPRHSLWLGCASVRHVASPVSLRRGVGPSVSLAAPLTSTARRHATPTASTPRGFFTVGIKPGRRGLALRRRPTYLCRGTQTPRRHAEGSRPSA
jgi:hypothetical protein